MSTIQRCDNCKKIINRPEYIVMEYGRWERIELCNRCTLPITQMIYDKKLLKEALTTKLQEGNKMTKLKRILHEGK